MLRERICEQVGESISREVRTLCERKVMYALCNMINNRPRLAIANLNSNMSTEPG